MFSRNDRRKDHAISFFPQLFFSSSSRISVFSFPLLPESCLLNMDKTSLAFFQQNIFYSILSFLQPSSILFHIVLTHFLFFLLLVQHPLTSIIQGSLCFSCVSLDFVLLLFLLTDQCNTSHFLKRTQPSQHYSQFSENIERNYLDSSGRSSNFV